MRWHVMQSVAHPAYTPARRPVVTVRTIEVSSAQQMHSVIQSFVVQGYAMVAQQPGSVTLVKRKQFSVIMLLIGMFLFVLPMFLYLLYYALKKDQYVEVRLVETYAPPPSYPTPAQAPPQPWNDRLAR